jgi:hypothetical protein
VVDPAPHENEERPKMGLGGLTPASYARRLVEERSTVTAELQTEPLLKAGGLQGVCAVELSPASVPV